MTQIWDLRLGYGPSGGLGYGPIGWGGPHHGGHGYDPIGGGGPHRGGHGGGSLGGSVPYLSGFTLNAKLPQKLSVQSQIIKLVYNFTKTNQHVIMFKCVPSSLIYRIGDLGVF